MNLTKPLQRFMLRSSSASSFLFVAAILAAILANSPFASVYDDFFSSNVYLQIGDFNLLSHNGEPMTMLAFVNDALMVIFFFVVGLEIKRELLVGELSSFRKAILPFIAACGGMLLPILIYTFICSNEGREGLAIPMATDIAFSLGVLSLLGTRVPLSLKIFLTAFAVVDDIGGILVIAIFYSSHLAVEYLLVSVLLFFALYVANKKQIGNKTFYVVIGIGIWFLFLQSGIHSTISGVLVALMIPAKPHLKIGRYIKVIHENIDSFPKNNDDRIVLTNKQIEKLKLIESASDRVISPLQSMEDKLHRMVNYLILPLFAFANAGVVLNGNAAPLIGDVTLAVGLGLLLGKFVGIFSFTFLAIKTKIVPMPVGMNWKNLAGVSLLGGIGFTVSLFIANLSFSESAQLLNQAKLGVVLGTIVSGLLGYFFLNLALPKVSAKQDEV